MEKLTEIYLDLQRVPPDRLYEVHQLVKSMMPPPISNEELAARTLEVISSGPDNLSDAEWDAIIGHMRQVRAELFTRPNPFSEEEEGTASTDKP